MSCFALASENPRRSVLKHVTPVGSDLLKRMNDLPAFASKWAATQAKKK